MPIQNQGYILGQRHPEADSLLQPDGGYRFLLKRSRQRGKLILRMSKPPRLTPKRRENLVRLISSAATIIFGGLVIGAFIGGPFRPKVFLSGLGLYFVAAIIIWWLEP